MDEIVTDVSSRLPDESVWTPALEGGSIPLEGKDAGTSGEYHWDIASPVTLYEGAETEPFHATEEGGHRETAVEVKFDITLHSAGAVATPSDVAKITIEKTFTLVVDNRPAEANATVAVNPGVDNGKS